MSSASEPLSGATWRKSSYSDGHGGDCLEVAEDFPGAATWRKSSHSDSQGGACLEVAQDFPGAATWRKSSHSNGQGGDCLEVAEEIPGLVPVRDSKAGPEGPALVFRAPAWASFVGAVRGGGLSPTPR